MQFYREHSREKVSIHAWTDKNFEFAPHWHTPLEIVYVMTGTLQAQINGTVYHVNEGDILLCGINDIHSFIKSTGRILFILISLEVLGDAGLFFQNKQLVEHCIRKDKLGVEAGALANEIAQRFSNKKEPHDDVGILLFHGKVLTLLGHMLTILPYEDCAQKVNLNMYDYIRNTFTYINQHFCDEDLSLKQIAAHIGISDCYLSRCFKLYSGYTLTEYINRKRVEKANMLLKGTDKNVTEIALECGCGSLRNFNRIYKSQTGKTPHEVRQSFFMVSTGAINGERDFQE